MYNFFLIFPSGQYWLSWLAENNATNWKIIGDTSTSLGVVFNFHGLIFRSLSYAMIEKKKVSKIKLEKTVPWLKLWINFFFVVLNKINWNRDRWKQCDCWLRSMAVYDGSQWGRCRMAKLWTSLDYMLRVLHNQDKILHWNFKLFVYFYIIAMGLFYGQQAVMGMMIELVLNEEK